MATYSFLDVSASITGPGGSFDMGAGAGVADEGIDITRAEKDTMTIGADGTPMHSMSANQSGSITARFLKTSSTNAKLQRLYDFQSAQSALWGNNTIVVRNSASGDVITAFSVAFKKSADLPYKEQGGMVEWEFNAGRIHGILGEY